jgi:T-complex protein 1 subunit beta
MDTDKIKIFGARVKVDGTGKLAELERAERVSLLDLPLPTVLEFYKLKQDKMKAKVDAIASHGINVFVNRQLIYNYPESLLAEKGILTIEHADFEGVERLSLVTGGEIASTFERPDLVKLGRCDLIEEVMIGEDKVSISAWDSQHQSHGFFQLIKFSGVAAGEACTVVLRGSTNQMIDEAERSLHDALSVLSQTVKETRVALGGGCAEMLMSCAVDEEAKKVIGKKAIAVEAFSHALRQIPTILADNAGYDSSDLVSRLRAAHYEGRSDAGLGEFSLICVQLSLCLFGTQDMNQGSIGSMRELGVTESYKLKRQVILSASEAAEMIIR